MDALAGATAGFAQEAQPLGQARSFLLLAGGGEERQIPRRALAAPLREMGRANVPSLTPGVRWVPGRVWLTALTICITGSIGEPQPRGQEKNVVQMVPAVSFQGLGPPFQLILRIGVQGGGQCRRAVGYPVQQVISCAERGGRLRQFRSELLQIGTVGGQLVKDTHGIGQTCKNLRCENRLGC